jgi:hypothetical protein
MVRDGVSTPLRPMDFIAGAKILAERFGDTEPAAPSRVSADAHVLFHWCGVDPRQPQAPDVGSKSELTSETNPGNDKPSTG